MASQSAMPILFIWLNSYPNSADYINYVNYIINNFYKILSVVPDDFDTYDPIKQLNLNITLCRKFPKADSNGNIHQYKFHELVVDALSYDKIRACLKTNVNNK